MEFPIFPFEDITRKNPLTWDITPIEKQQFKDKVAVCPTFGRLWDPRYNFTKTFIPNLIKRTKGKLDDHVGIHMIGRTGIGKTRVAQVIAKKLYSKIGLQNISFAFENTLRLAEKIDKGGLILQDESMMAVGMGSEREALDVQNALETTRDHRLSFIFLSPSDRNFVGVHFVLEVVQRNIELRKSKVAIKNGKGYLGFFIVDIPEDKDDKLYMEYLPYMTENKKKIRERQAGQRLDFKSLALEIKNHPRYYRTMSPKMVKYLIREANPRLTENEIGAIESAYGLYIRYKAKKEKEEELEVMKLNVPSIEK